MGNKMTKIVSVCLILLMSLTGCSGDKVSRQPTAKLSSGSEDNPLLSRNNSPSDPLQISSNVANLHQPEEEEEARASKEAQRKAEAAIRESERKAEEAREAIRKAEADRQAAWQADIRESIRQAEEAREAARQAEEAIRESARKAEEAREASRQAEEAIRESIRKAEEAREASRQAQEQAAERQAQEQAASKIEAHIEQIYGKDSTASEEEQWYDIENYGYTVGWLNTILYVLEQVGKRDTPFYIRVSNRKVELFDEWLLEPQAD
jgi:hypothetical protein